MTKLPNNNLNIPLQLSIYFLSSYYPGNFNLDSRIFIEFPIIGEIAEKNNEFKSLSICIELNSAFKFENLDNDQNFDGIKTMIQLNKYELDNTNIELQMEKIVKQDKPLFSQIKMFENAQELILNLKTITLEFSLSSYENNWNTFVETQYANYSKKTPFIFLKDGELEKEKSKLIYMLKKLPILLDNIFSTTKTLTQESIDELIIHNKITISQSDTSITSTLSGVNLTNNVYDNETYKEFKKLLTALNFYQLDNQLTEKNKQVQSTTQRVKL